MKFEQLQIAESEVLQELDWKKAIATGALAATAAFTPSKIDKQPTQGNTQTHAAAVSTPAKDAMSKLKKNTGIDQLSQIILAKYKHIDPALAKEVATMATKHADPVFPTAQDILAIVGIESSFDPNAVSALKRDPAIGLMQTRPGVWNLAPADLKGVENQIRTGAGILSQYHQQLKSIDSAVHAYNVGITNFRKQKNLNPGYVDKYKREKTLYSPQKQSPLNKSA